MKLPSLHSLSNGLIKIVKRFPIQVLIAFAATICSCYLIQLERHYDQDQKQLTTLLIKAILVLNLALTLTLALDLFTERKKYAAIKRWLVRIAGLALSAFLYFWLNPTEHLADLFRIALLSFSFHLLISFAPFTDKQHLNGFWQFNKALFLRFLTSALYSGVLFAGLAAALGAISVLFNAKIEYTTYMTVFAIIAAGFNTIFFLGGVPDNFSVLEEGHSYPKGLKLFTQFVLIPLMTIYLAILLVYEIKIIIDLQLPKGLVSSLIMGYAVFGILSLLLVHPIKETEGNKWIKLFSKFFYLTMIPLIVLLMLAIWKRIGLYGITESRYILVVLALWLVGITVYFLLSRKQNIKVIPVSLSIIALLAVYGPQSAFSISKYSQLERLKKLSKSNSKQDKQQASDIIEYLVEQHGLQSLQPLTTVDLKNAEKKLDAQHKDQYSALNAKIDTAFSILKIAHINAYTDETRNVSFVNSNDELLNVKGYDYVMDIERYKTDQKFENIQISIDESSSKNFIFLKINNSKVLNVDLKKTIQEALVSKNKNELKMTTGYNSFYYPVEKMTFSKAMSGYEFTIIITSMSTTLSSIDTTSIENNWINASKYLLIKKL